MKVNILDTYKTGVLLQSKNSVFGSEVYLCFRGKRHYVSSVERIRDIGFHWPDGVVQVPESVLKAFEIGGNVPKRFPDDADPALINSSVDMREYIASPLTGFGLEVGAGASPFPIPLHCRALYGDKIPHRRLVKELYPGQQAHNLVIPDILTDFDDFNGIADNSLDFITGCHVIEHTLNPIGSILAAHSKLKAGGKLVLVVPDKERTFDKERPLTTLEHLMLDYAQPDRQRDYQHYLEFFKIAFPTHEDCYMEKVEESFTSNGRNLHFHVWDYKSFLEMVNHIQHNIVPWSTIWSQPTLSDHKQDIEFYFVLTK